jgi:hypothetical protein
MTDANASERQWRLEDIYASTAAWEADAEELARQTDDFSRWQGRLHESSDALLAALRAR